LTIPFDDLLANGFKTRQTDVRPAKSINTAMQLVAVIFQLQSLQQFGGVSASHIDWTMVPYVRMSFYKNYVDGMKYLMGQEFSVKALKREPRDISINDEIYLANPAAYGYALDMTTRECHQAVEGMYHNLNTLQSRSGNQLPFTSINYGTCTLPEGRLVTTALLEVSIEGLGEYGRTSIFPCGIFQCMKGVNREPGTPNYDLFKLALKSTSQRIYPNYCNCDTTMNAGYDKNDPTTYYATMGCRTVNGFDINGMGQKKDGRGNIAPVTIILPTLAMEAKLQCEEETSGKFDDNMLIDYFMRLLETKIEEAKDILIERFNWICKQPMESAKFMYENGTMAGYDPKEGIVSALKHGTLTIGLLGMNECAHALIDSDHYTGLGKELTDKVVSLYTAKCKEYKESLRLNFAVYYTPAENLCHTALKNFRKKYGVIPGVSDRDYFTNSIHVPVWKEMSPFEKIDIESQWANKGTGGTITYVELPSTTKNNIEALEVLVNYAMDKDIPYFAINLPIDCCEACGYQDEIGETCPKCGSDDITRLRRVTGYLTGDYKTAFNNGKVQETDQRVKHIKN
jgi:ribonucleoside-triphosphate reductase